MGLCLKDLETGVRHMNRDLPEAGPDPILGLTRERKKPLESDIRLGLTGERTGIAEESEEPVQVRCWPDFGKERNPLAVCKTGIRACVVRNSDEACRGWKQESSALRASTTRRRDRRIGKALPRM